MSEQRFPFTERIEPKLMLHRHHGTYRSPPQSTLVADTLLTGATEHTEFLMMNVTPTKQIIIILIINYSKY